MISTKKLIYKMAKRIIPNDINVRETKSNVAIANDTITNLDMYTATKTGFFLGSLTINYPSNATGIRSIAAVRKAVGGTYTTVDAQFMNIPAASGGQTILTIPVFLELLTGQSLAIRVWQNSGSSLTVPTVIARGFFFSDN